VYLTNTVQAEILVHAYPDRLADGDAGAQALGRHAQARTSGMLDLSARE